MANDYELQLPLNESGLEVLALVHDWKGLQRWTGSSFSLWSSIADINWETGMVQCQELLSGDATPTATYVGNFPVGITQRARYGIQFFKRNGVDPILPDDMVIGTQDINWRGDAINPPEIVTDDGYVLVKWSNGVPVIPPIVDGQYCTIADMAAIFGLANIQDWADQGEEQQAVIDARLNMACMQATTDINDRLRGGPWVIPFDNDTITWTIIQLSATLAGVWAYENKGVQDFDPDTGKVVHRLMFFKQRAEEQLSRLRAGQLILDIPQTETPGTRAPGVVNPSGNGTSLPGAC